MSVGVKAAAFAVLVRVLLVSFGDELSMDANTGWPPVLAGIAAITMFYGNFAAIAQSSVKRMLAYSSIAHAGYILVGVVAAFRVGDTAVSAVLYYLMAYTVSNALAFGSLIYLGSKGKEAVSYEDLAGVGRRHPACSRSWAFRRRPASSASTTSSAPRSKPEAAWCGSPSSACSRARWARTTTSASSSTCS
jgi:NADH-quinone oxidoreductase subunit N